MYVSLSVCVCTHACAYVYCVHVGICVLCVCVHVCMYIYVNVCARMWVMSAVHQAVLSPGDTGPARSLSPEADRQSSSPLTHLRFDSRLKQCVRRAGLREGVRPGGVSGADVGVGANGESSRGDCGQLWARTS